MNDDREMYSGVNRRRFLQGTSVAGVGLVGVGSVDAATSKERGTVTFAASAVTHGIDFPSKAARAHSLLAVNTLPEHAIFVDDGILSYNHFTTRETARLLEENQAALWHEDYQALPVSNAGSTQKVWVATGAIDHPRVTEGALLDASYRPPGFDLTQHGETVRVTVGSEQFDVAPGERFEQELPGREIGIKVSQPSVGDTGEPDEVNEVGTQDTDGNQGTSDSIRQLTATPTVHVTNYGELTIRSPDDWTPRQMKEESGDDWSPREQEKPNGVTR